MQIPITRVSPQVHRLKGFPSGPFCACLTCMCGEDGRGGACCDEGVYADKESYDLIIRHGKRLEAVVGPVEACFERRWKKDDDEYLGKKAIGTRTRNGMCMFRKGGRCAIVELVLKEGLPRRMIPSACRIYPLTWDKGVLKLCRLRKRCVCVDRDNRTRRSIFQTQRDDVRDIFSFDERVVPARGVLRARAARDIGLQMRNA